MINMPPSLQTRFSSPRAVSGLSSRWITFPATTLSKLQSGKASAVMSAFAKVIFWKTVQFFSAFFSFSCWWRWQRCRTRRQPGPEHFAGSLMTRTRLDLSNYLLILFLFLKECKRQCSGGFKWRLLIWGFVIRFLKGTISASEHSGFCDYLSFRKISADV